MKTEKYTCGAVVVGTGAGGAVAGATLAAAGVDTILLEEGSYYRPEDHGTVFDGLVRMYMSAGTTVAMGRPPVSITLGRTVGGTTAINSSTCFRPPRKKVGSWGGPSYEELEPFFEKVEKRISAQPADIDLLGGNWRVLKRGCDKLGVEIKPLVHNISGCRKRGRCQFGCPEGAKQSMEVTFVPDAVEAGARLLTGHSVTGVIVENGRAVGVEGESEDGRFEVRARAVVLSMGAMRTPVFLIRNRLGNSSGRVGHGLMVHPACRVVALFDEIIDGHIALPQGAFIDKWTDRGIMLEGIFIHPGLSIPMMPGVGHELKETAVAYRNMSAFGVMVSDTSSGRVMPGHFGASFLATYQLSPADARSLHFGIARLTEIYLAAGAKKVYTAFHPVPEITGEAGLEKFEAARVKPNYFEIGAFHPLGTCSMGADPKKSVVDFSLKTHDVDGLYIMDASVIPASLGVNPQITIMSLAMRGSGLLAKKLGGSPA